MPRAKAVSAPEAQPKPQAQSMSNGNTPDPEAFRKKILKQRTADEALKKRKGETYFFEVTNSNTFMYTLKGDHTIYIPEDWRSIPDIKGYLEEVFSKQELSKLPVGEQDIKIVSSANTIFVSQMDERHIKAKSESVTLKSGVRNTPSNIVLNSNKNKSAIQFLMLHGRNSSCPLDSSLVKAFKQISKSKTATLELEKSRKEVTAMLWAAQATQPEMMTVATVLGLEVLEDDIMRHQAMEFAKANPEKFMAVVDDPLLSVKSMYMLAKKLNVIIVDGQQVKWSDGNGLIQFIPKGQNEISVMSAWLSESENAQTYDAMVRLVYG